MYDPIVSVDYAKKVITQAEYYNMVWKDLIDLNPNDKIKFNYDTFSLTFENLVNLIMRWS
eukprot:Pgem_evm1s18518